MKLALGTAQFGLDYGISNQNGQVVESESKRILALANTSGINTLDTAAVYGNSEKVIGNTISKINHKFNIVTKITLPKDILVNELSSYFDRQISVSLKNLQTTKVYAVMLHNVNALNPTNISTIFESFEQLKTNLLCQKVGVSVYTPEQLFQVIDHVDIIQIPLNIIDQRFSDPAIIEKIKNRNIEVHARSLFLQGLILMNKSQRPSYFDKYQDHFQAIACYCQKHSLSKLEACFAFAKSMSFVDKFVVIALLP